MFDFFARHSFDWAKVHLFWVDERGVPPTDPQSNFKLANDHWLTPGKFPAANIHRVEAEFEPETAARKYQDDIVRHFGLAPGAMPAFDVIHRGMGPDAHTASLFPGEPRIQDHSHIAAALWVEKMHQWRITVLPGVLEAARNTVMLVVGADKAEPLRSVLSGPYEPSKFPCQIGLGEAEWFLDQAAAQGVSAQ